LSKNGQARPQNLHKCRKFVYSDFKILAGIRLDTDIV
jgi:hypothetical protein